MPWTSSKKTGEIRNQQGRLIATTELGQRQHTELLGQVMEMRKMLTKCLQLDIPEAIHAEIRKMIFKTR